MRRLSALQLRIGAVNFCGGLLISIALAANGSAKAAQPLFAEQMMRAIYQHYPNIRIAELEVTKAAQEIAKVSSQLGWSLSAEGGYAHELSFIDSPVDRYTTSAGIRRTLESGAQVGITGGYSYEDNQRSFSPIVPNPTERTRLEMDYRMPLGQGQGNPAYERGLKNAEAQMEISEANFHAVQDRVAEQALSLFHDAAVTRARIDETRGAIERARRLVGFTRENMELGLAEDKDILQAQAQLQSQLSNLKNLQALWERQRITLNRLMGRPWSYEFEPQTDIESLSLDEGFEPIFTQVSRYSPQLRIQQQQVVLAESAITLARDERDDELDLILNIGAVNASGDTPMGGLDEDEIIGGVRLEYRRALDRKGLDARLYQAQLDQLIAEEEIRRIEQDLQYDTRALLMDIKASQQALQSTGKHLRVERRKYQDALERYQVGRADTDQLIRFENELSQTRLQYQREQIELARKHNELRLLRGDFSELGALAQ